MGPQTSWPLRGAHLALIVCFCTRKEHRSPHDLLAQAAIFFCKRVGGLNPAGDIEPWSWAWVAAARIRNMSPVATKQKDRARIGSPSSKGASCLLYRTIECPFGHKNVYAGRSVPTWNRGSSSARSILRRIQRREKNGVNSLEAFHSVVPNRRDRVPRGTGGTHSPRPATSQKRARIDKCLQQTAGGTNNAVRTLAAKRPAAGSRGASRI